MSIVIQRVLASCCFLLLGGAPGLAQSPPANFQATVRGPTEVYLSWNAVAGTTGYHVFRAVGQGSFTRLTTFKISPTSYTDAAATASTTFRYRVAAVDAAGQTYSSPILTVTTPATHVVSPPRMPPQGVAVAIPPQLERRLTTTGRYRISIAGFRVNHETYDDPLERDGKRDEVFALAVVQQFNRRTGAVVGNRRVQSKVFGDANGFPDRVPQGSASNVGGLRTGDVVPAGWDERSILPSPNPGSLPLVLWEGQLTNGDDALVLRPTIWEWDGDQTAFEQYLLFVPSPAETWQYGPLQQTLVSPSISLVRGSLLLCVSNRLTTVNARPFLAHLPGQVIAGRDRPVGIDPNDGSAGWCDEDRFLDRLLLVTREKIEYELTRSGANATTRLMQVRFQDVGTGDAAFSGDYSVHLRLERMP